MLEFPNSQLPAAMLSAQPHYHFLQHCPERQEHFNRNVFSSQAMEWASTRAMYHRVSLQAALCTLNSEPGVWCGVRQLTLLFHSYDYLQVGGKEKRNTFLQVPFQSGVIWVQRIKSSTDIDWHKSTAFKCCSCIRSGTEFLQIFRKCIISYFWHH